MMLITRIVHVETGCRVLDLPEKNQGLETVGAVRGVLRGGLECRYGGLLGAGTMEVTTAVGMTAIERAGRRTN